ncbi:MAG: AMIN-like domain-containing (lipo)protein [Pseudonocardiaceae bacterium]
MDSNRRRCGGWRTLRDGFPGCSTTSSPARERDHRDFEGVLSLGVGMRTQTWVHTSTLTSPTRVVIDVGR